MKLLDYLPISTQNYWKFQIYIFSRFEDIANIQLLFFTNKSELFGNISWKHLLKAFKPKSRIILLNTIQQCYLICRTVSLIFCFYVQIKEFIASTISVNPI